MSGLWRSPRRTGDHLPLLLLLLLLDCISQLMNLAIRASSGVTKCASISTVQFQRCWRRREEQAGANRLGSAIR